MQSSSEDALPPSRSTQPQHEPIAIIGVACLFPGAGSLDGYWSNIKNGVDSITEVPATHWRPEDYFDADPKRPDFTYSQRGGFLSPVELDPAQFGIAPNSIEATDTSQLLGLIAAHRALVDAGYGGDRPYDREKVSVILGVTGALELAITLGGRLGHPIWRRALERSGITGERADQVVKDIGDSYVAWQENSFPGLLGNVVAGRIANRLDLGGTNCVVDAACASSLSAAHLAVLELTSGRAEMAITGGVDTFNDIFMYMCFSKTPALSPTGDSRPFSTRADGTILGEGVGMVVLKKLSAAERDGDRIYAVVKGIGTSSDGRGKAIYAPSSSGQARALTAAYREADVSPATVELVEAHGTGTKAGDAAEVAALKEVYSGSSRTGVWCALGSVKSQIGHTKAAAGVAGMIKAALALRHKVLPPTIKVDEPAPEVRGESGPFYVNTAKRPWLAHRGHPRRAAVSSFGFGGSNFHMVLEEHKPEKPEIDWDGRVEIVALSAENVGELRRTLETAKDSEGWDEIKLWAAKTRRAFRSGHPFRLLLVLEQEKTKIPELFGEILKKLEGDGANTSWALPQGAYFGCQSLAGKLAFLFPGQGSQYVGMCMDLACLFPQMQGVMTQADLAYGDMKDLARQLSDFIYPIPGLSLDADKMNELALRATEIAQPAIGAISMGALLILSFFGVHPAAAAGHSFGELMALFAAGRIDATELLELSRLRGELMAAQGSKVGGGSMLAVQAPVEETETALDEEGLDLVIANHNAPRQVVISGATAEIERAEAALRARKFKIARLPVSAAFHSALVADAAKPFRAALENHTLPAGTIPVYANTTGKAYPEDASAARDILGGQLARPVRFVSEIEAMYADGARIFLEVGPGAKMTGLVRSILDGREHHALAIDASAGKASGVRDLARVLAQLAALGHPVDLSKWENGEQLIDNDAQRSKPRMTVKISGANYQPPRQDGAAGNGHSAPPPVAQTDLPQIIATAPAAYAAHRVDAPPSEGPLRPPTNPPRSAGSASSGPASFSPPLRAPLPPLSGAPTSPASANAFESALHATQQNLLELQRLQQQTAELHRRFLEGQEAAQRTLHQLLQHQQQLFAGSIGMPVAEMPAPSLPAWTPPTPAPPPEPIRHPVQISPSPVFAKKMEQGGIEVVLLDTVSEKTGYPVEMLKLDMDMESDLGIDSIKRVEILSAMQERLPDAPVVQPEQLGTLRTLQQVIDFLTAGSGEVEAIYVAPKSALNGHHPEPAHEVPAAREIQSLLIEIVSEKTGYPAEMLKLDMDMESDLGIDSIKRVEILSSFQERMPEAPVVQPEDLGKLRTLRQVLDFLAAKSTPLEPMAETQPAPPVIAPAAVQSVSTNGLNGHHAHSEPAREDSATLRRGVLVSAPLAHPSERPPTRVRGGAEVWITDEASGLSHTIAEKFQAQGFRARVIGIAEQPALETNSTLGGLIILVPDVPVEIGADWNESTEAFLKASLMLARHAAPSLMEAGRDGGGFFSTVSRMDGVFGLSRCELGCDPAQGGLAGLVKSAAQEWPGVACKALDVARDWDEPDQIADAIVSEILLAGPLEVGLSSSEISTLAITESPSPGESRHPRGGQLSPGDVVVISGGARGVTAECALALAGAFRPTLVLLGRTPPPREEPVWARGRSGESELKRALVGELNGQASSLKVVEEEYRKLLANREVLNNIERIQAAGASVLYRQVDIRDEEAVAAALERVRAQCGPIRGLIHGAGVLADRKIEEKTPEQFDAVFQTKVGGLRALLKATREDDLQFMVLFSSVSGRFGRAGQSDYAMANEVLNKAAHAQAQQRPGCRVVSINWGPWEGGMVTPSLRKIFQSEGVGLIELDSGASALVHEIRESADAPIEVVLTAGGELGETVAPPLATGMDIAFRRSLDLESHPFLRSHGLKGRPVVPLAMIAEWLGHAALHANPGFHLHGLNDLRSFKGIVLSGDAPYSIVAAATKAPAREAYPTVRVELRGGEEGQTLHASAEATLATRLPSAGHGRLAADCTEAYPRSVDAAYDEILFHGSDLRAIRSIAGCSAGGIVADLAAAPAPETWMTDPLRSSWIMDPLIIDGALQLIILWCHERTGEVCLPGFISRYRQYRNELPCEGVRAVIRARASGRIISADVEFLDASGNLAARMEGCEFVFDPALRAAFAQSSVSTSASL